MNTNGLKLRGNGHNIPLIYFGELSDKERTDFDYTNEDDFTGFRYKGQVYDLGDMEITDIEGFDGISHWTCFSGILVKIVDSDYVKVYSYCS